MHTSAVAKGLKKERKKLNAANFHLKFKNVANRHGKNLCKQVLKKYKWVIGLYYGSQALHSNQQKNGGISPF